MQNFCYNFSKSRVGKHKEVYTLGKFCEAKLFRSKDNYKESVKCSRPFLVCNSCSLWNIYSMPECCKQVSCLSLEPKLCQSFSMLHGNNFDAIILLPRFNLKRYYNNTRLFSRSVKNSLGKRLSKFDHSRCHRSERLPLSMNTQRNHCARILLGRMETHAHRTLW